MASADDYRRWHNLIWECAEIHGWKLAKTFKRDGHTAGDSYRAAIRVGQKHYGQRVTGRMTVAFKAAMQCDVKLHAKPKTSILRASAEAIAKHCVNRNQWVYTMSGRRGSILRNGWTNPWSHAATEDCSSFATAVLVLAGIGDPNHLGNRVGQWHGGYTGSMITHGKRINWRNAQPGDCIFYGRHGITHVTVSVGGGMCVSFGSEPAPRLLPAAYRSDVQYGVSYI